MSAEASVAGHYSHGRLEHTILNALAQAGKDVDHLTYVDLAAVDHFHLGGLQATTELAAQMGLRAGMTLLDVGCGIGGPARYFAAEYGCNIAGIDLTPEFIDAANSLTRRVHLEHLARFQQASALDMPFESATFDGAYMIHVGMNIPDKLGAYREVRRVLKPDALFAIFDVMLMSDAPILYPVPWALSADTSFLSDVSHYRDLLREAGFRVVQQRGLKALAIESTERGLARAADTTTPPPGIHLLMGAQAPYMIRNALEMLKAGVIEPVELIAHAA